MVIGIETIEIGIEIEIDEKEIRTRTGREEERGPLLDLEMEGGINQVDEIVVKTVRKIEKQKRSVKKKERRRELLKKRNVTKKEKRNARREEFSGKKKLQ